MHQSVEPTALSLTGRHWQWPQTLQSRQNAQTDARTARPAWLDVLLERRGIIGTEAVEGYLAPTLAALEDPHCLRDIDRAVARLRRAQAQGDTVIVYGDYDVDGVCSTSILVDFLRHMGLQADFYIPDRRAEGYGLNHDAVTELIPRCQVLITVDCGITAYDEIALARAGGLDVIVVDHHQVPDRLPPAIACLNPHRLDCDYPFKDLCAAGVAFMLVAALRRALREAGVFDTRPEPDIRQYLDLVAVATVADMVPLCASNRVLVAAGLRRMRQSMRPGLQALCAVAKVDAGRIGAADLGFRIGPRINARGRMSQAGLAVDLMLAPDVATATPMAAVLDAANLQRRQVEQATVAAALQQVEAEGLDADAVLVVHGPSWHAGVLGLVASRLVARYHRPAVVIGEGGKGSGRSVPSVDLHAALTAVGSHLLRFGGHPAAAGLTIAPDNIDAFRRDLAADIAARLGPPPFAPVLRPDLEVDAAELDLAFLACLERLAPFGQGNPEPLFGARNVAVRDRRRVGDSHLKLRLGQSGKDAIAFGLGHLLAELPDTVDVLFHLERNVYAGRESLQMRVVDVRGSASTAGAEASAA